MLENKCEGALIENNYIVIKLIFSLILFALKTEIPEKKTVKEFLLKTIMSKSSASLLP